MINLNFLQAFAGQKEASAGRRLSGKPARGIYIEDGKKKVK